jgi:hypothetical protein
LIAQGVKRCARVEAGVILSSRNETAKNPGSGPALSFDGFLRLIIPIPQDDIRQTLARARRR